MKHAFALCILLTLCACHTADQTATPPAHAPAALNPEFLRSEHEAFSEKDRELIAAARRGIRRADKLPRGGSEDAYYRVRHTSDGHEVFVIYVTGYDSTEPIITPCVHNEVVLNREGKVLKVLGGPECWP